MLSITAPWQPRAAPRTANTAARPSSQESSTVVGAPRASIRASLTASFDRYGMSRSDAKARDSVGLPEPGQPPTSTNAFITPPCHHTASRPVSRDPPRGCLRPRSRAICARDQVADAVWGDRAALHLVGEHRREPHQQDPVEAQPDLAHSPGFVARAPLTTTSLNKRIVSGAVQAGAAERACVSCCPGLKQGTPQEERLPAKTLVARRLDAQACRMPRPESVPVKGRQPAHPPASQLPPTTVARSNLYRSLSESTIAPVCKKFAASRQIGPRKGSAGTFLNFRGDAL